MSRVADGGASLIAEVEITSAVVLDVEVEEVDIVRGEERQLISDGFFVAALKDFHGAGEEDMVKREGVLPRLAFPIALPVVGQLAVDEGIIHPKIGSLRVDGNVGPFAGCGDKGLCAWCRHVKTNQETVAVDEVPCFLECRL